MFTEGQTLICVYAGPGPRGFNAMAHKLIEGAEYTFEGWAEASDGSPRITLIEDEAPVLYSPARFREKEGG